MSLPLRPHQQEALAAITGAFARGERRVTAVSACGTGKTLTAVATARHIAQNGRVLVAVPTLELLTQTIQRWREGGRAGLMVGLSSMGQTRSGLPRGTARMVKRPADLVSVVAEQDGLPTTVFVTYASLPGLQQAHRNRQLPAWDLIVVDEAHRTCMSTQDGWGAIHDDQAIPARLRLYMTATPRVFTAGLWDGAPTATMDRRDIFGPVVYRLGMAEAIERGLLADYQVVMPVVGDKQLHAILTRKPHLDPQHGGLRAAALQVAVLRAITDHDLRRVLVFHNRIAAAEAFSEDLPDTAVQLKRPDLQAFWVDGTQRIDERRSRLSDFESADGCTVLSNVRVLAEGIDIPAIDSVVFAAPRNSIVDAIQAIGRALRLVPGRGKKATLVLPVYLPDGRATEQALHDSQFEGIYTILQALRAHDDSFLDHITVPRRSRRLSDGGPRRTLHYNRPERALQVALALGLEITLPATGSWPDGLASATRYHHDHHHLDVPHTFHDSTGFALGEWISNQRLRHLADRLPHAHTDALDALDMLWSTPTHAFPRILEHARTYAATHGHLAAPTTATQGGHPIGAWLADCRRKANAQALPKTQAAQLASLDTWWNPQGWPVTWRRAYAAAEAHIGAGGSLDVPNSFTAPDGFKLGQWLSRQRNHFQDLHPEQAQLLIDIGIAPHADSLYPEAFRTVRGRDFRRGLVAASCYLAREGNLDVPRKHTETDWIGPFRLGSWIDHIRRFPNELTDEERAALDILRMAWDPPQATAER
ncbi:Helicase associated domain protein [Streptomyces phaeochromogenes]|uniref:DEAD/DEAH box helicase n=1 Tax=Streptomyces phaeochromogenes TaxID=1923 RepID=UPI00387041F9|nr:Helicase associated domain protein [Streptomyces phaeochromogenes]